MTTQSRSWKTIRDHRRKANFVGRGEQLRVFKESLEADLPNSMVFSITGEGGVGKSTLLLQYDALVRSMEPSGLVVTANDRYPSPASVMGYIAEELREEGYPHREFGERYMKYRQMQDEIEADPEAPRSIVKVLALGVSDFTIKSLRKMPGVSVFFEYADERAAGEALAEAIQYGIKRWGNKDEIELLREPERILTPLFVDLVNKASADQRLVLMFDVFERTHDGLAPWLLSLFNFDYGEFNTNVLFVISGRDPLEQHWTELADVICHIGLEPFTPEENAQYLTNRGIVNDEIVQQIYDVTEGLPVLVDLLAATDPQPGVTLPDISGDAVARFLQWTPDEEQRKTALLAAVPRQFERDILGAAINGDAGQAFNWLSSQSYVRTSAERGCFYHEKVRELMLRYQRNTTPAELVAAHLRLADFFAERQKDLELSTEAAYRSDTWQALECERIYHRLSARPEQDAFRGLDAFLSAMRRRRALADRIGSVCAEVSREASTRLLGDHAKAMQSLYLAYEEDDPQAGMLNIEHIEAQDRLSNDALSELCTIKSYFYSLKGEVDNALGALNRAIELDPDYALAIARRGQTYRRMGNYEAALVELSRALALDDGIEGCTPFSAPIFQVLV